ncbi:MAG TPA: AAC(3) family N-acetyltransferase [Anaerolineae bacterium]|jgi:aminoglycoside 3-N-acetyltransferase
MNTPGLLLTRTDIAAGLRALGIHAGMGLMVHSSLRSFGRVDGGAASVVAALMDVLTPEGTLLMPTFNHGEPFEPGGAGVFNPRSTRTLNGAIPDYFWRQPNVWRSLDPTHPFAAWGRHAQRYIVNHHKTLTMGPQSPLGLLHADGGSALLLGVWYGSNTFHHVVEMSLGAPCLGRRTEAYPIQLADDGRFVMGRTWGWRERACPITDRHRYGARMAERGYERTGLIGACAATLFSLRDCYEVVSEALRDGMDGYPPCTACPIQPRAVAETVVSDWDDERQCLMPGSVALTY